MKPASKLLWAVPLLLVAHSAEAHLRLEKVGQYTRTATRALTRLGDTQKAAPCGQAGATRGTNTFVFRPGTTVTVAWDEYIPHPGHFRISFDPDGDDGFAVPRCLANCDTTQMQIEQNSNDAVLLDGIQPQRVMAPDFTCANCTQTQITLPDMECNNCTLQVIQVMTDKPPYTTDAQSNDLYYQCVDMVLSRTAAIPEPGTTAPGGGSGGNANPGSGSTGDSDGATPDTPGDTDEGRVSGCAVSGRNAGFELILFAAVAWLLVMRRRRSA